MPSELVKAVIPWQKNRGVILLADIVGFFPLVARLTLDELAAFLCDLYGMWGHEVRKQGGEVVAYVGDSVLAVFRSGGCQGKDPEWCATLTAFHLMKGLKRIRPDMEMNVALHQGEFLEAKWEEQGRTMHNLLGNVVNQAAAMVAGNKTRGIMATKAIVDVLGPRVKHDRCMIRFPNASQDETIFRLLSLVL
ncbi:MAG: hypothetical protein OZSIB_1849 [Candidatus Ozemobacter sibiricus]|jgi:adenylate cyclase|uniref:Guanylate cyclase domain-containing protein n=1 Tax=Candidatus Ozemobacter sibiricus TaxID=2268124 RepID=A0A367ZIW2_9BACT|nr:MAG: hypothetical protein OZSIB_1849 [Candidatus Ozemobacter sibiricus]